MNDKRFLESNVLDKLKDATTKIARRAYDVINADGIAGIIADTKNNVFWFESYSNGNNCPACVFKWLKKYIRREYGHNYLYDVVA